MAFAGKQASCFALTAIYGFLHLLTMELHGILASLHVAIRGAIHVLLFFLTDIVLLAVIFSWNGQLVLYLLYHPWYEISKCCVLVLMTVSCYLKCQSTHKTKFGNVRYIITLPCWQYPPNYQVLKSSLPNVAFAGWLQKVSCPPILPFVVCWILHIELLICCGLWHVVISCWNCLFYSAYAESVCHSCVQ